jgi:hypothetical protein
MFRPNRTHITNRSPRNNNDFEVINGNFVSNQPHYSNFYNANEYYETPNNAFNWNGSAHYNDPVANGNHVNDQQNYEEITGENSGYYF